jgi:hypothetical protein
MESYIIRVYRRDEENQEGILGQVVDIQTDEKLVFSSVDDLMKILCSQEKIPEKRKKEN